MVGYCVFAVPDRSWQRLDEWLGNRLYAETNEHPTGAPGEYFRRSYSFDLTLDPIGEGNEEPLLTGYVNGTSGQTYWDHGPGWLAYRSLGPLGKTKVEELAEWVGKKLGKSFGRKQGLYERVRFHDPITGQLRYAMPVQLTFSCEISPDGRRVA
jgi:hypothetical protein